MARLLTNFSSLTDVDETRMMRHTEHLESCVFVCVCVCVCVCVHYDTHRCTHREFTKLSLLFIHVTLLSFFYSLLAIATSDLLHPPLSTCELRLAPSSSRSLSPTRMTPTGGRRKAVTGFG